MSSVNTNDSLVVDEEAERKQREEKQARLEKVRKKQEEIKRKADEKRSLFGEDEDDDTTATPTQAAPAPLREDVIASSVAFLNHPKVKPSPLAKKMEFLQKKGLTQAEIQEAVKRAEAGTVATVTTPTVAAPVTQAPAVQVPQQGPAVPSQALVSAAYPYGQYPPQYPPQYYLPVQQQQQQQALARNDGWASGKLGFAVTAASCVAIGMGAAVLARKYFSHWFGDGSIAPSQIERDRALSAEQLEATKKQREDKQHLEDVTSSIKTMQQAQTELKDLVKTLVDQSRGSSSNSSSNLATLTASAALDKATITEMQSEIKRLKAMMLDLKTSQVAPTPWSPATSPLSSSTTTIPSNRPGIPSWMLDEKKPTQSPDPQPKQQQQPNTTETPNSDTTATGTTETSETANSNPPDNNNSNNNSDAAQHPKNFAKIAAMVQEGQIPDDVRTDIDDKPADPDQVLERGKKEARPKPWEKKPSTNNLSGSTANEGQQQ